MTPTQRTRLIARYRAGAGAVATALRGIRPAELDYRPAADAWTAREVVHHLADSETISGIRLRRLLVEEAPVLQGYDENVYARRLAYGARPIGPALDALRAARATTVQLLERMDEADWQRAGTHTESGPYSAERWLELYAAHAHDHAAQIRRAREAWRRRPSAARARARRAPRRGR
jgi:hypothetical protein